MSAEPSLPLPAELPLTADIEEAPGLGLTTQLFRFIVSGGLSAIVDFGLYMLFLYFGWPVALSKSLSFICGTTTAYLINRRWTFAAEPNRKRFAAVILLYAVTFAVQVGINELLFSDDRWRQVLAFVVAQGTATVINFVVQRAVIFKLR